MASYTALCSLALLRPFPFSQLYNSYFHLMCRKILLALLALFPFASFAQKNMVDEIIWVVGDEPIRLSDVEEARITAEQQGSPVDNPYCTIP